MGRTGFFSQNQLLTKLHTWIKSLLLPYANVCETKLWPKYGLSSRKPPTGFDVLGGRLPEVTTQLGTHEVSCYSAFFSLMYLLCPNCQTVPVTKTFPFNWSISVFEVYLTYFSFSQEFELQTEEPNTTRPCSPFRRLRTKHI